MNLEVIEQPGAKMDFLRYKIGRKEKRKLVKPNFAGRNDRRIVGYTTTTVDTEVFHILGFGSTREKAEQMAARSLVRLESK